MTLSLMMSKEKDKSPWNVGDPVLLPRTQGSADATHPFDEVAVKDPSVVFFEGRWHVFYTARSETAYTTGYVSAKALEDLQSASRHELPMIRGKRRYGCAPQIFYYTPQQRWYLIFQTRDANYQPAFSTTPTIAKPETWREPEPLLHKDTQAKWIDFWVICDETRAYLFYTQAQQSVIVRSTDHDRFPHGWSESTKVFDSVHEAVHVYKVKGQHEFHMIYELNKGGVRSFGLAKSEALAGPWKKVTDRYAAGDQLEYSDRAHAWTDMVSHGEVLRSGYDEYLAYDPQGCRWLIQGILRKEMKGPYPALPWKLGVMTKGEP